MCTYRVVAADGITGIVRLLAAALGVLPSEPRLLLALAAHECLGVDDVIAATFRVLVSDFRVKGGAAADLLVWLVGFTSAQFA